jgi:hypothetical protein
LVLHDVMEKIAGMSTMDEMIKQWEIFHHILDERIRESVQAHVDGKLSEALADPDRKNHAIRVVQALSPDAAYRFVLTR